MQLPILNARAALGRYYVGFDWQGPPGYNGQGPWGVKANVYTISPSIPFGKNLFQWVSVIISYSNGYWLQLGYEKGWTGFWVTYSFYYEKCDIFGDAHIYLPLGFPGTHHTYTYAIWWDQNILGSYRVCILEGSNWIWNTYLSPVPDEAIDLQAKAEMKGTGITIDGTHFTQISYTDKQASGWYIWPQAVPREPAQYYDLVYDIVYPYTYDWFKGYRK